MEQQRKDWLAENGEKMFNLQLKGSQLVSTYVLAVKGLLSLRAQPITPSTLQQEVTMRIVVEQLGHTLASSGMTEKEFAAISLSLTRQQVTPQPQEAPQQPTSSQQIHIVPTQQSQGEQTNDNLTPGS